jgi:ribonuclease-3
VAVDGESAGGADPVGALRELLDHVEPGLARNVFTHSSWSSKRSESYERLAFLGDSVLSLAITSYLYPNLDAERFGAGELTKVRAQTVSGRACRVIAEQLGVPERLTAAAPPTAAAGVGALIATERVLASICEAVIGACYLSFGYERTAAAVVEAFTDELDEALKRPLDFKSELQEQLARRGEVVSYEVIDEVGPPHERIFTVAALLGQEELGRGSGRSKKDAEQVAAELALASISQHRKREPHHV